MPDITTIPISGLTPANASASDLIEIAQTNSGSPTGYASMRTNLTSVANLIASNIEYSSELQTTDKTLTGAINELKDMIEALQQSQS